MPPGVWEFNTEIRTPTVQNDPEGTDLETESGLVIVFTRYPAPGSVKTRLIPALGPEGACRVHRILAERTMGELQELRRRLPLAVEVHFTGGDTAAMAAWLGREWDYVPQGAGDLGSRLEQAATAAFRKGRRRVILIGSDCPELKARHLLAAWEGLTEHDLVLGPARDGGYYLIGLKRSCPALFPAEMPWGTDRVLAKTRKIAERLGLRVQHLDPLADVDRPEDLSAVADFTSPAQSSPTPARLSIIIPTLNEARSLPRTLDRIGRNPDQETIVVDGGSRDETGTLAGSWGARVLHSPPGRAVQMNQGAAEATGELFLFLHADTLLPTGFADLIQKTLSPADVAAGAFRLRLEPRLTGLPLIERLANWRAERWQLPYGDQGLFLTAETFRETGGFPEIPFMEDLAFVQLLKRRGKIALAPAAVISSSRRWQTRGVWRTTGLNQIILLGYLAGCSPDRLSRWYRPENNEPGT